MSDVNQATRRTLVRVRTSERRLPGPRRRFGRLTAATLLAPLVTALGCVPGANPSPDEITNPGIPFSGPPPAFESPVKASTPPPPITGGTLRALADGRTAVAADPDRDQVFIVDYKAASVLATITLQPGDEPGRVAEDGDGRVHVALRRGGAVLTLTPGPWQVAARRAVCAGPRGIAFDKRSNGLLVACADGDLVSLPAAPDGAITSRRTLDRDLRDVVVSGDNVLVSRFRSAEVFKIDAANQVTRVTPPSRPSFRPTAIITNADGTVSGGSGMVQMTPAVAWRMLESPNGDVLLMHQRGADQPVSVDHGGYGGAISCSGIVETTVTRVHPTTDTSPSAALDGVALGVDMAISPDGKYIVMAAPGNSRQELNGLSQVTAIETEALLSSNINKGNTCMPPRPSLPKRHEPGSLDMGGTGGSGGMTGTMTVSGTGGGQITNGIRGTGGVSGVSDPSPEPELPIPNTGGEVTAVAFDSAGVLLAQTSEPATLQILNGPGTKVFLSAESRRDTGHGIFHANSGAGLACASCHPEGGDDGRVWIFAGKDGTAEPRRTQNLRGGVLATAPFHWDGKLPTVQSLMTEVFVGRMGGPTLSDEHLDVLSHWLDGIPAMPTMAVADPGAVERGSTIFKSAGCGACHMGTLLTDNRTQNVGTGLPLQTPSLRGVAWRAPYMHTGCAKTLDDRFVATCGGGDSHGKTSTLDVVQRADLIAYLQTL